MNFSFTQENLDKIEKVLAKYPDKQSAVMPVLYIAQEQNGYVSIEVTREVARVLEMDETDVLGVATFYSMYHENEPGKYHIQVCTSVSCMLHGGNDIFNAVKAKLGVKRGGTTPDKKFSLEEVECMGSCGTSPMMVINEDYYENLTPEKALQIIESLK